MIGLGTIINTAAVIAGGLVGLIFKKGIGKGIQDSMVKACGAATLFIGISGAMSVMLTPAETTLKAGGTMLLILSLVIGTAVGEALKIEDHMERLGERIKKRVNRKGAQDGRFTEGFVNVSLIICVGAMAVIGSIQDGVSGDYSMLAAKSVLDCIISMVFSAVYGIGAIFSATVLFIYQGALTLAAAACGSFVNDAMLSGLSLVGSALIFCVGINLCFEKKFRVGNMLPSLFVPVIYEAIKSLF